MKTASPTLDGIIGSKKELLTAEEAAVYLDTTSGTLAVWRTTGRYAIPFIKRGRSVRYRRSDLDVWLESRTRHNGATA